jgi:hypothetical protein
VTPQAQSPDPEDIERLVRGMVRAQIHTDFNRRITIIDDIHKLAAQLRSGTFVSPPPPPDK